MMLDQIDQKILNMLQKDASVTNVELSDQVGLSPSACLRRVEKLKKAGAIRSIRAEIDPAFTGQRLAAIISVRLERHGEQYRRDFMKRVQAEPSIAQAYVVTGEEHSFLIANFSDMEEYKELMDRMLHTDPNVVSHSTHFVIEDLVEKGRSRNIAS